MAAAETARLLASLELQDKFSPTVSKALAGTATLESRLPRIGRLGTSVGNSLGYAGNKLRGLATGGLALLGLGGGFAITRFLTDAASSAREFGTATFELSKLTGLSVDTTSRLVDTLDKFGISADAAATISGMYLKNVDKIASTTKTAAAFQKEYGLSVLDAKGKVKDFNAILLDAADFFNNKSIPANQKAAALAKLFGRNWKELIPILAEGRKGLEEEERTALHMSDAEIKALAKNREATRNWEDALGDLKVRIGTDLLPTLTEMMTGLTTFVETHGDDIRDFFRNALSTGKGIASTALAVVGSIQTAWGAIPAALRDIIVKGLVADRTVKFLFGFSPIGSLAGALESGFAKAVGSGLAQAGLGKLFVQPVFVTNAGFGTGGGGVPGAAAGAGGLGLIAGGLALTGVAAALVGLGELIRRTINPNSSGEFVQQRAPNAYQAEYRSIFQAVRDATSPAQTEANRILSKISYESQRDEEIGRTIRANTANAYDALEDIRNKRWQITNRVSVPVTVRVNTGFSTYEYAQTLNRQTTSRR